MNYTLGDFKATEKMRENIQAVLDSGRISYGPFSKEFEHRFAFMHASGFGVLSNSGTSSLQVALQALKILNRWQDGDEVIVPALTFVATINIVYHCNLKPILVDVDPNYYAIDPDLIERAITPRTRCIIPVHPFGQPADMPAIMQIAKKHNLRVIEDSCEAMRANIQYSPVGSWGDIGCFSMYVAHLIVGGIGGIGICKDESISQMMRSLVNHGIDLAELPSGDNYDPSFIARKFRFSSVGHSFRITEMEAALLLPQLDTLDENISQRQRNARRINKMLIKYSDHIQLPSLRKDCTHSYMVYPIVMRNEKKNRIMQFLRARNVECRDMLPLTTQPCYDFLPFLYPVSSRINEYGFYIGCHQNLSDEQFDHLEYIFDKWFDPTYADLTKDVQYGNF